MKAYTFSMISKFQRCQRQYHYSYMLDLERIRPMKALHRGTVIHMLVEAYWKDLDWRSIHKTMAEHAPEELATDEEIDLWFWLMERYEKYWGEYKPYTLPIVFELEFRAPLPGGKYALRGFCDRLIVRDNKLWLVETKTMGSFDRLDMLSLDPQLSTYMWALRELGYNIWGAEYDAIYTYRWKKDERPVEDSFKRITLDRDQTQLQVYAEEAAMVCEEIDRMERRKRTPSRTVVEMGPMSCKNCAFFDPCFESLRGYPEEEQALLTEGYRKKEGPRR